MREARGFESALHVIADRSGFTCIGGDQRVGGMPTKMVDGKTQARFVSAEQLDRAPVLLSKAASGDDIGEFEKRLGLEVGEGGFTGEGLFIGGYSLVQAAESEERRGSIDVGEGMVEVLVEFEVAIEEIQGHVRMGAGEGACLDA